MTPKKLLGQLLSRVRWCGATKRWQSGPSPSSWNYPSSRVRSEAITEENKRGVTPDVRRGHSRKGLDRVGSTQKREVAEPEIAAGLGSGERGRVSLRKGTHRRPGPSAASFPPTQGCVPRPGGEATAKGRRGYDATSGFPRVLPGAARRSQPRPHLGSGASWRQWRGSDCLSPVRPPSWAEEDESGKGSEWGCGAEDFSAQPGPR